MINSSDTHTLHDEGRTLGRFILGSPVDSEFVERYAAAHEHLVLQPSGRSDAAILALAMKVRVLLPSLAAASALIGRDTLLHKKSLLMAAILEASPRYADAFLPRPVGAIRLSLLLAWTGLVAVVQLVIGLPILWFMGKHS